MGFWLACGLRLGDGVVQRAVQQAVQHNVHTNFGRVVGANMVNGAKL